MDQEIRHLIDMNYDLLKALIALTRHIATRHPADGCCALVLNEHLPDYSEERKKHG